jgi:hypothetical protein
MIKKILTTLLLAIIMVADFFSGYKQESREDVDEANDRINNSMLSI